MKATEKLIRKWAEIREHGDIRDLAITLKMHPVYVHGIVNGKTSTRLITLQKIDAFFDSIQKEKNKLTK